MKQEMKDKWCAALVSGKYLQGQEALRNDKQEFCCLGVLLDIVMPNDWEYERIVEDDEEPKLLCKTHVCASGEEIDTFYLDEFGLNANQQSALVKMNDYEGKSFTEIAAWIQENIP